jgi:hypothetical protein
MSDMEKKWNVHKRAVLSKVVWRDLLLDLYLPGT